MSLNFKFVKEDPFKIKSDIFVIECKKRPGEEKKPGILLRSDRGIDTDKMLDGIISKILADEKFTGETGSHKTIPTHGKIASKYVMVVGIGDEKEFDTDTARKVGAVVAKTANELNAKSVSGVLQPENFNKINPQERLQALAEGFTLGSYRFDKYKNKKDLDEKTFGTVFIHYKGNSKPLEKLLAIGTEVAEAINFARDLVNTPGDDMTPEALAKEAVRIAKGSGLTCKILDEKAIKTEKMGLITAVSQGSKNPPRLIHLKYNPTTKAKAKIVLIGKGVTFDSGGYNLKTTRHIEHMKCDMAGAAAVLGVMMVLPKVKPLVAVEAIIPAAENMIDGKAHKPGDVIRSRNGKTVEILNTDAEGRLLLADAMDYALGSKPDVIIDLATLTGGVRYALGEIYTAILGNDQKIIDKLIAASKEGGEPTWQLPLVKDYLKGFKEGIADLNNNGKTYAMTISGALFLEEFIGKTKWAHFDIAESAWAEEERDYRTKGGTGTGIQTLIKFLQKF